MSVTVVTPGEYRSDPDRLHREHPPLGESARYTRCLAPPCTPTPGFFAPVAEILLIVASLIPEGA